MNIRLFVLLSAFAAPAFSGTCCSTEVNVCPCSCSDCTCNKRSRTVTDIFAELHEQFAQTMQRVNYFDECENLFQGFAFAVKVSEDGTLVMTVGGVAEKHADISELSYKRGALMVSFKGEEISGRLVVNGIRAMLEVKRVCPGSVAEMARSVQLPEGFNIYSARAEFDEEKQVFYLIFDKNPEKLVVTRKK